ncbi:MAG: 3'-5' exonuclease [Lautropia sp.]
MSAPERPPRRAALLQRPVVRPEAEAVAPLPRIEPVRKPVRVPVRESVRQASSRLEPPDRDAIEALPPFEMLGLDRIVLVDTPDAVAAASAELGDSPVLGFDTESKPTFVRGEISDGPHLVQFATLERAWLFPLRGAACIDAVMALLASRTIAKAGFGLDSDRTLLAARLGAAPNRIVDLDNAFRAMGYRRSIGLKSAVAMVFGQRFVKSKKIGTSNWASPRLNERQLLYAANDAYAAIRVHDALVRRGDPGIATLTEAAT